jgi:hypothetical protein
MALFSQGKQGSWRHYPLDFCRASLDGSLRERSG